MSKGSKLILLIKGEKHDKTNNPDLSHPRHFVGFHNILTRWTECLKIQEPGYPEILYRRNENEYMIH